jgi:hypothetical protein
VPRQSARTTGASPKHLGSGELPVNRQRGKERSPGPNDRGFTYSERDNGFWRAGRPRFSSKTYSASAYRVPMGVCPSVMSEVRCTPGCYQVSPPPETRQRQQEQLASYPCCAVAILSFSRSANFPVPVPHPSGIPGASINLGGESFIACCIMAA